MQSINISITGEKNTSFTVVTKDEYEKKNEDMKTLIKNKYNNLETENQELKKLIEDKYEELKLKKENEELNQLIEEKKKLIVELRKDKQFIYDHVLNTIKSR